MRKRRYLTEEQSQQFRKAIRYILEKTHISQINLAETVGVSRQSIWIMLNKTDQPITQMMFSAVIFGITYAMCIIKNMSSEEIEKLDVDSGLTSSITDEVIKSHLKHTT